MLLFQTSMGTILQSLIKKNVVIYKPEQWSTRLGESCKSCNQSLSHQKCISVCNCNYFCHLECFSNQFQQRLLSQFTVVKCQQCKYTLKLVLQAEQKYQPECTKQKIIKLLFWLFLIILILLSIALTGKSDIKKDYIYLIMYTEGILLGVCIFFFVQITRQIMYHKSIKIKDITSTNMEIETSAFRDFDCKINQQSSKEFIPNSENK